MQPNTRRQFIQRSASWTLGAAAGSAMLSSATQTDAADRSSFADQPPTLVAIYLRGGADPLGIFAPYTDPHYAEHRPTLALSGPEASGPNAALGLDNRFGLNPRMTALHELYEQGMVAPILCVGSPHPTRSHFEAQDFMEHGAPGMKSVSSGWLNRYLEETDVRGRSGLRAFSLQPLLPPSLRGPYPVLARPRKDAEHAVDVFDRVYERGEKRMSRGRRRNVFGRGNKRAIAEGGERTVHMLRKLTKILEQVPTRVDEYPDSRFGRQMRNIAKVIRSNCGLEVTAVDYGGWDHHDGEGPIEGALGNRVADVSEALAAFATDLGPRMDRVMVLLMSEFGRTVRENGSKGTDHGHGGFMLALGGMVRGGQVYGKWTGLEKKKLYQGRDLPVHTDFRVVFSETLHRLFDYDGIRQGLFPDYTREQPPLEFLRAVRS